MQIDKIGSREIMSTGDEHMLVQQQNWQNWRLKSLNSGSLQRYSLPVTKSPSPDQPPSSSLPPQKHSPQITKISNTIFSILLNNTITIFQYIDDSERQSRKQKTKFTKKTINNMQFPTDIQSMYGDNCGYLYVSGRKQVVGVRVGKGECKEVFRGRYGHVGGVVVVRTSMRSILVVMTKQSVITYNASKNYETIKQYKLEYSKDSNAYQHTQNLHNIQILAQSLHTLYHISTSVQLRADIRIKLHKQKQNTASSQPQHKKCEVLYLTKLQLNEHTGITNARIFLIDHIFQIGIFNKSRMYQIGKEAFIMSLYEEIVVIRKNFGKFVVWDNVSIASSKSNEKKGQLALADKRIMVYTEQGQISAHEVFFNFTKSKLETPKIDSFKGNNNEQQILYDAIILQYKPNNFMKVLFYFKQSDISLPNQKQLAISQASTHAQKSQLFFQTMCIQQTQPNDKLKQLLQNNKSQQQIQSFLRRFNIGELRYKKSQWEVSVKGLKEVENLLMGIKDNQYIQTELTKILKEKPHDLQFLMTIQRKQIDRYRLMVASKIFQYEQYCDNVAKSQQPNMAMKSLTSLYMHHQLQSLKQSIQWLLQSKMLYKKLVYSLNFMSFKQYDFIQIGKLRTASLREEIKLLGVKGYQKRLKYFLNSFKYLVLDDFREILRFVIADLSQREIGEFFMDNFSFILPNESQDRDDRCRLWDDTFKEEQNQIQTIPTFTKQIQQQVTKLCHPNAPRAQTLSLFSQIFSQFIQQPWFTENKYKQHSLLQHNSTQLQQIFLQLKQVGVYNIIVQYLYEGIDRQHNAYTDDNVKMVVDRFVKQGYFGQMYVANLEARLEVWGFVAIVLKADRKKYVGVQLPKRHQFIIQKQQPLIDWLVMNFLQPYITTIKLIYQSKMPGLFLHNITLYLQSPLPQLQNLIQFMKFLKQTKYTDIRKLVFKAICDRLSILDVKNGYAFVGVLENVVVDARKQETNEQAKVVFGCYLAPLFILYGQQNTFSKLLAQTNQPTLTANTTLHKMLQNYPSPQSVPQSPILTFPKCGPLHKLLPQLDTSQIIDFLALILYIHKMLDYKSASIQIWRQLIYAYIDCGKYQQIGDIVQVVQSFGRKVDDRRLADQWDVYAGILEWRNVSAVRKEYEAVIFQWVQHKYKQLTKQIISQNTVSQQVKNTVSQQVIKQSFFAISKLLQTLNQRSSSALISTQISRISLFSSINTLSPALLLKILPSLISQHDKYNNISSYTFMLTILKLLLETPNIFSITIRQQILSFLSLFTKIHKQYSTIFNKGNNANKNQDTIFGQLCRFNCQFVCDVVGIGHPRLAGFVLIDLMNSSYYYRDVLLYFGSRVVDRDKIGDKAVAKFVYQSLVVENPGDLAKILNNFIVKHQLASIVSQKNIKSNVLFIFKQILDNNKLDQAFFYAIRNTQIQVQQFQKIGLELQKFREDHVTAQVLLVAFIRAVKDKIQQQNWPTFMLFKAKINCLMKPNERIHVIKDIAIVMGHLQIQYLKQKMKTLQHNHKTNALQFNENANNFRSFLTLKKHYQKFMKLQNLNPLLSIHSEQISPSAIRLQKYPDYSLDQRQSQQTYFKILPIIRQQQSAEVKQLRKKLFQNEKKLKSIQDSNRQLMEEQLQPAITQAKMNAEKQYQSLIQRKKKKKLDEEQEVAKRIKTQKQKSQESDHSDFQNSKDPIAKLENQQNQKVAEMKKTYTSKIVQQTQNLIAQLRQRRKKVKQQTALTYTSEQQRKKTQENMTLKSGLNMANRYEKSIIGGPDYIKQDNMKRSSGVVANLKADVKQSGQISPRKSAINTREQLKERLDYMRESHLKGTTINRMMADKNGEYYVPRWQPRTPMRSQFEQLLQDKPKKSSQFLQKMKKQMAEQTQKQQKQKAVKQKSKIITLQQMVQKSKKLNQPQAIQILQKLSLVVNNSRTCTQLLKNMYNEIKQLKNFIQLCKDLLIFNTKFTQYIQQKSLKIAQQSLKIKISVPFKQVFPAAFFTTVHNSAMRDYYHVAYTFIHPNLMKMMQLPNCNVNGIAMMIRFGFGSDSTFYYKVFQDYVKSLLENYGNKEAIVGEKDMMILAEKLRINFSNLSSANRKIKFEQLIKEVKDGQKRKDLIKAMAINLENKSSLVNKESYQQFRIVLAKLEDTPT